jgi:CysZ protein
LFKGLKLLGSPELCVHHDSVLINVVLYSVALTLGYFYISDLIASLSQLVAMAELVL